ncbi:DUF4865 family protein [Kitasatospora sp. NPDC052896]|uniref:DUF4865 family protein n=1 Tax=Kitasatospora sp. NPDC052896 TaxID=3364061 RepID=UPI0037C5696B
MQAMQYAITLPADYDMGVIRRRVADRGHLLDDWPGLALKAYLIRERGVAGSPVNQYAPFYLWRSTEGMNGFLWGPGFRALCADFGRPEVRQWGGLAFRDGPDRSRPPVAATRRTEPIPPGEDPVEVIDRALARLPDHRSGTHCTALAVDTTAWELLVFTLWSDPPAADVPGEHYQLLHLSSPELDRLTQGRHW